MNLIAQVVSEAAPFAPLAQYGLLGAVLGWFMYYGSKLPSEISRLAHRIDGLTKAMLVDLIERDTAGPHAKKYALQEIAKIDAREKK